MPKTFKTAPVNRIIDANINRAKEGLRVCEEVARFVLSDRGLTAEFKRVRHGIDALTRGLAEKTVLLEGRDSLGDIGKGIYINELKRKGVRDIYLANLQRAKESVRVLEEFSKLISEKAARGFKDLRYRLYAIEKKSFKKIASLRNPGQAGLPACRTGR